MKLQKTLALILALLMASSLFTASAFAEDTGVAAAKDYQIASQEQSGAAYYLVTFQWSDGNSQTQLVRSGSSVSLPAATAVDASVRFDGWYADNFRVGGEGASFTPLSDVTLVTRYTTTSMTKAITSESNLGHLVLTAPTGFLGLGQGGLPGGSEAEANWAAVGSGEEATALAAVPAGEGMVNRAVGAFMLSLSNEYWQQNSSVHANISFNRSMELKENETLTLVRVSGGPQIIRCNFSGNPLSGAEFSDDAIGTYVIVGTSPVAKEVVEEVVEGYEVVTSSDVVLRAAASGFAEVLATIPAGTQITVISEEGDWTLVKLLNGIEGYVYSTDLQEAPLAQGEMKISIFSDRRPVMEVGEPVTLTSRLEGFDGYELYYIWEVDKGSGFEEIPDTNAPTYSFPASAESLSWDWRLEVLYR